MVEVLVVFEVNSLQELALACLTAYLCSLLRMLYSAQYVPPFLWARWWALLTLCLLVSSSVVHQVSLWDSVMVFLGQDMSSADVILLYRYASSVSIVWLSQFMGCSSHGSSSSWVKSVQLACLRGRTSIILCLGVVMRNLMYLWSLIEVSSKTFQSLVELSRLGEVKVTSMTDFPTGEWKVGIEPLLRMLRPCWKIRFSSFSPLLSKVFELQRLLCALESMPHMNLMLDVMQWSIV